MTDSFDFNEGNASQTETSRKNRGTVVKKQRQNEGRKEKPGAKKKERTCLEKIGKGMRKEKEENEKTVLRGGKTP